MKTSSNEVYSLVEVEGIVKDLQIGDSVIFDMTTNNDKGSKWDFSNPEHRRKAMKKITADCEGTNFSMLRSLGRKPPTRSVP